MMVQQWFIDYIGSDLSILLFMFFGVNLAIFCFFLWFKIGQILWDE